MEERPIENRPDSLGSDAVRKEKRGVGAQSAAAGAEANWVRFPWRQLHSFAIWAAEVKAWR